MKYKIFCLILIISCLSQTLAGALDSAVEITPADILKRVNENFLKIKDASADISLDYNIHLLGCTGLRQVKGQGYYKSPDRIKTTMDKITYFARGNRIRKIDAEGKKWYVKLIDAIDFNSGFTPNLLAENFVLSIVQENQGMFLLEGIPKPGRLTNVRKVFFYIDRKDFLLREIDVKLVNERLKGQIKIDYEKIKDIWVPTGFQGESAVVFPGNILVGMSIKLRGENMKINTGLPDKLFDPGF
ncbi:MAG: hypothetical protein KJ732_07935 [Candidatus Margulisbacteria bacterium]|nr:hypothetical protein [Candidatus Margulisiibacteriota bacterium]